MGAMAHLDGKNLFSAASWDECSLQHSGGILKELEECRVPTT
jgi:hypothetical protein